MVFHINMLTMMLLLSMLNWQSADITTKADIIMKAEVTAYCSCEKCCGKHADGITASGHKLKAGDLVVAAPRNISFGTKIFIPGYGLATVRDRGGAIKGNRLDIWFSTHDAALKWGRQNLEVVYEKL